MIRAPVAHHQSAIAPTDATTHFRVRGLRPNVARRMVGVGDAAIVSEALCKTTSTVTRDYAFLLTCWAVSLTRYLMKSGGDCRSPVSLLRGAKFD
jgi:hypothetical protein